MINKIIRIKIFICFNTLVVSSVPFEQPIRTLRVATSQYKPFIFRHNEHFGEFAQGIEFQLIKTIAQMEIFQLQFVEHPKNLK